MWTVIYLAQNIDTANKLIELLESKGLLVKLRTLSCDNKNESECYEVLVPETEVDEAHSVLIENNL